MKEHKLKYEIKIVKREDGFLPMVEIDLFRNLSRYEGIRSDRIYELLHDMEEWCKDNECGWLTDPANRRFKFRNEEQMTLFLLRWVK